MAETTRNMFNNGGVLAPPRTLVRARLPRAHRPHRHRRGQGPRRQPPGPEQARQWHRWHLPRNGPAPRQSLRQPPDMWLRLQMAYDLAQALKREAEITRDLRPVTMAG